MTSDALSSGHVRFAPVRPFVLLGLLGFGGSLVLSLGACGDEDGNAAGAVATGGQAGSGGQAGGGGSGGLAGAAGAAGRGAEKGGSAGAVTGGSGGSASVGGSGGNGVSAAGGSAGASPVETPLGLAAIPSRTLDEDESTVIPIVVTGSNAEAPLHLSASGLPAGAELDPVARVIRFRPDFIQGGGPASAVTVRARRGAQTAETSFSITVANTIVTPEPAITGLEDSGSCQRPFSGSQGETLKVTCPMCQGNQKHKGYRFK